jgi:hypothetical protein
MNQTSKTIQFVVAAIASAVIAGFASWATQPSPISDYKDLNEEFFPDLKDPGLATAVRVVAYNETTASAKVFTVEQKEGVWRIPSHHNYPADGKDRLAKTANSLLGTKRTALVSRVPTDHERFGVIDPLDDKAESLKGRGQRITLLKSGDVPIADLIIGKKVEGKESYYVRKPDETKTYIADLKVDLSTKFKDWVEDDLLKLERDNLVKLESKHTEIADGGDVKEDVQTLTREKSADPWKLGGINEENEEVNKTDIDAMVGVLDNLKLVGIRERPRYEGKQLLQSDLTVRLPKELSQNRQIVQIMLGQLRSSLEEKGFMVYQDQKGEEIRLYSAAGELVASTNDGVRYHMNFGNVFAGSDEEIEIGAAEKTDAKKDEKKEAGPSDGKDPKPEDDKKSEGKKSRYLFLRTSFDESLIGPKPLEPTKPEVPEGVTVDENGNVVEPKDEKKEAPKSEAKPDAAKTEEKKPDAAKPEEKKDGGDAGCDFLQEEKKEEPAKEEKKPEAKEEKKDAADPKKEEAPKPEPPKTEPPKVDPVEEYKKAVAKYRLDKAKYEVDLKSFNKKVEEGQKRVKELNDRFGNWYYVISAEDFDKLRLKRDQLVKAKELKPEEKKDETKTDAPTTDKPEAKSDDKKPAAPEKTEGDKPAAEPPKKDGEAKATDEKKADEKKPEADKPATEAKPDEPKKDADKPEVKKPE